MFAIAHTDRISVPGFTGEGYILFDPVTGSGAYKITGGANGGSLSWCSIVVIAVMALAMAFVLAALMAALMPALVVAATVVAEVMASVASYIAVALAGLSVAARAAATGSLLAFVSSQVAAGDMVTEICRSQNPNDLPKDGSCLYQCPSDGAWFFTGSKLRLTCNGGLERYCPGSAPRPPGLKP